MSSRRPCYVLDAFAVLAYLQGEGGMVRVKDVLAEGSRGRSRVCLSLVNLGEVLYIVERESGIRSALAALAAIEQLPIEILPASRDAVLAAAHVKAQHRISYADAFAVAAAQECGGTILTADPEFQALEGTVQIEWLPAG